MSIGLVCILAICIININIFSEKRKQRRETISKLRKKERMKKRNDILNGKYDKYLDERSKINLNKKLHEEKIRKIEEIQNSSENTVDYKDVKSEIKELESEGLKDINKDIKNDD